MDLAGKYTRRERRKRAEHLLEIVGLTEHLHKLPSMLSGGQQQRAAVARALANDPPLVIADEPTGNLDSKTAETIFSLFNDLVLEGKTVIIVTHDSSLAKRAHRTALIADGEIVNEYVVQAMPTLNQDQLLWATRNAKEQTYQAGAMIFTEGTNADAFYIVSKGTVEIVCRARIKQTWSRCNWDPENSSARCRSSTNTNGRRPCAHRRAAQWKFFDWGTINSPNC